MATKARQQYFADEISLQKQRREFSLEDNIKQKIDSVEAGAQVNTIETVKVNGTALTPDANKAVNVEVPDVIDNLYSTSTDDALSAKQGKVLYDYLQNIASRGRFLSNWNCATGLPVTNPTTSPYTYMAGDYYSISNVATGGGTNYRPDGSSYTIGQASTTTETEEVNVSDFYLYDGTNWLLLVNTARQIAVDSSLSTTSTNPVENRVVTNAINAKVGVSTDYGNDLLDGAKIWFGTETDYSSMISRDSNTMYIQYVTSSPTPPSPGRQPGVNTLVYYNINNNDTNSTIYDLSGNGNDLSGAITYTTDAVAGKTFQSGRPTHSIINFGNSYTFISWVYITGYEGMGAVFTNGAGPASYASNGISTYFNGQYLGGGWNVGDLSTGDPSIVGITGLSLNTWCMIAYSRDSNGDMKIYINGGVDNTVTDYHNPVYPSGTNFMLGGWGGGGNNFQGMIKVLIGENKTWTAQEIADYFDQTKGDYGIS